MQIHGFTQIHGPQTLGGPHAQKSVEAPRSVQNAQAADQLDLSDEARRLSDALSAPDIRADKVLQVRQAIREGVYDTDEKLEIALNRLLDDLE